MLNAVILTFVFGLGLSAGGGTGDQERLGKISPGETRAGGTSAGSDIVRTGTHKEL